MKYVALIIVSIGLAAALIMPLWQDKVTVEGVKQTVDSELKVGMERDAVEQVLLKHQMTCSFDKYANAYQCIIRDVSRLPFVDKAIVAKFFFDADVRYVKEEVYASFTFL